MSKLTIEQIRAIIEANRSNIYCDFPTFFDGTAISYDIYRMDYYNYLTQELYKVQIDPTKSDEYNEDRIEIPLDANEQEYFFEWANGAGYLENYRQGWWERYEEENSGE